MEGMRREPIRRRTAMQRGAAPEPADVAALLHGFQPDAALGGDVLVPRGPRCLELEARAARIVIGFGAAHVQHNMRGFATTSSSSWWRKRLSNFAGAATVPVNEFNTSQVRAWGGTALPR